MTDNTLAFASNGWHVFSILFVFLAGLWLAIIQRRVFEISHKRAVFLYLWHTAFCLFYFYYAINNVADSNGYYRMSLGDQLSFSLGTQGINYLTSLFSVGFGLSYGGTFLIYNIFGYVGMLAFASALQQVASGTSRLSRYVLLAIILMPGLSFWSAAIGKDALTFMGAGLATWAALDLGRRYPALVVSALAFTLARPHMAGILLASLTFALLFSQRVGFIKKSFLILLALAAAVPGVVFVLQFVGLGDATSAIDIDEYFTVRQGHNLAGGSSVDIAAMSVPVRLLTYMFRPLFFDAGGLLGLVVSFENSLLFLLVVMAFALRLRGRRSQLDMFSFMFYLIFTCVALFVLANTTANLGIAIRQKWMFLPMLLVLACSYIFRKGRR